MPKALTVLMLIAVVLQLFFVALTYLNAGYQVWKFWGYNNGYIDYSPITIGLFGIASVCCFGIAIFARNSLSPISLAWARCAHYSAMGILVIFILFYILLASPAFQIRI